MSYQINNQLQVNSKYIPQFLSIALGGNPFLHPYIDQYYRKNEWVYYEAYQRSGLKDNSMFAMYTTKSEEKIRQVAGIVEWCNQNGELTVLDQLIKKGYKFVYQYVQRHSEVDLEHFVRSYAKKQKNKQVTEIELFYQNIVLWYLCTRENKPLNTYSVTWQSFQDLIHSALNEVELEEVNFSNQVIEEHKAEINALYEEYHIPKNPEFNSFGVFLEFLIGTGLLKILEINPAFDIEKAQQLVFQQSPTKHIGALGGWLKILKIHELDATEQMPFSKRDLDMVFMELLHAKKHNHLTKEEQDLFIMSCFYMKCLSYLYRDTKKLYLDQSKQDYYLEMKAKETRILQQEKEQLRKEEEWNQTVEKHQKKIAGLTQELREANLKIRQLEQQIDQMEDSSKEVHALRSYVYHEEQVFDQVETAPSLQTMTNFIQSKRIIIFGGHPNWRQKLKDILPSVDFMDVDDLNRDITKIQRFESVFINTSIFAHTFYRKIMKEVAKSETSLFYLNGQSNVEKTITEIYHCLNR
jgi:hypothetical protein